MYDVSNANTFLRSALESATTYYELGRLRKLLTSQEDAQGGAIIFIFHKAGAYRESANLPRHPKMTLRKFGITYYSINKTPYYNIDNSSAGFA